MNNLLPPNATNLEKNVAKVGSKISNLHIPFVELHSIEKCPVSHLPWLAWQYRVEYWNPNWSEQEKRQAVRDSKDFNMQRGTRSSISSLLKTVVTEFEIKAWHEFKPMLQPHTFVVTIPNQMLTINALLQIQTALDATKSARDIYSISANVRSEVSIFSGGICTTGETIYLKTI